MGSILYLCQSYVHKLQILQLSCIKRYKKSVAFGMLSLAEVTCGSLFEQNFDQFCFAKVTLFSCCIHPSKTHHTHITALNDFCGSERAPLCFLPMASQHDLCSVESSTIYAWDHVDNNQYDLFQGVCLLMALDKPLPLSAQMLCVNKATYFSHPLGYACETHGADDTSREHSQTCQRRKTERH